ncbi:MAG: hypothetical protein D6757_09980 [Alphaproteobacteria bacterium]|nr:MAG: hypothetical protein D6757_09980 [Alphaproteobacteria bacterium]
MIRIARSLLAVAEAAADAALPAEACGLLVGRHAGDDLWIESLLVTPNRAPAALRARRFRIDPAMHAALQRRLRGTGSEIVGVFHSHPQGPARPSTEDLASARPECPLMLILSRAGDPAGDWQATIHSGAHRLAWRIV